MKVKLDEHIPVRLSSELASIRHDVDTVASEGLTGSPDSDVWSAARREDRLLITQDLDFSDLRQFKPGIHAGLLLVRLREPGANALIGRVRAVAQQVGLDSFARCFVRATEYWYLRWWSTVEQKFCCPYRETSRQTYALVKSADGWLVDEMLRPAPRSSTPDRRGR